MTPVPGPPERQAAELLARADEHITQGHAQAALALLERAVALRPQDAGCWYKLGVARLEVGLLEPAESCFRKALELEPCHAKAGVNLGMLLQLAGKPDEAERHYRDALRNDPHQAQAWFNLGTLFLDREQRAEALNYLLHAVRADGKRGEWHSALASAYSKLGRPVDALASLETALRLDPAAAAVHDQLALCLLETGDAPSAVAAWRRAQELHPVGHATGSNVLFALNFIPEQSAEDIYEQHLAWARRYAAGLGSRRHGNPADPDRALRVGYVSPDLRGHSVSFFMEPVMRWHDRSRFQVACYSDVELEDDVSRGLRGLRAAWHVTAKLTNEALAQRIHEDRIDILVDLAGHSAGGRRMLLFASKPAPVQVSWLGYLNTTGLESMDYRITDWHACPEGTERYHTERLVRMPHSQWCFNPLYRTPDVGPLPALQRGAVTFGSFHQPAKLTPQVLALWGRLLRRVPGSRLLIVARGADQLAERIADKLRAAGANPDCVEFHGQLQLHDYLSMHDRVDINLDAFPYSGGTTTFHSLWMGVPVVTLKGRTAVSRGGVSVLTVLGLQELIADTEDEYVEICAALAGDRQRLAELRGELRQRLLRSPLMDGERFTRDLEAAYRDMWRNWCAARKADEAAHA